MSLSQTLLGSAAYSRMTVQMRRVSRPILSSAYSVLSLFSRSQFHRSHCLYIPSRAMDPSAKYGTLPSRIRPAMPSVKRTGIGCETCNRMSHDDGSWNKWSLPSELDYHICHVCFSSSRNFWPERLSLCEKASIGTGHFNRNAKVATTSIDVGCTSFDESSQQNGSPVDGVENGKANEEAQDAFSYSSIGTHQIRVLSILPGTGEIHCTMERVDFDLGFSDYAALSYCWGPPPPEQEEHIILIEGQTFKVLDNLFNAIKQLRTLDRKRRIWIDAICINQTNTDEKNNQLPMMGRIYSQASGVIVWLGSAADNSDEIMDIIPQQDLIGMQTRRFGEGFVKLVNRPWFSRVWVVQEFVLGKVMPQIFCGSRTVPFGQFAATHWFLPRFWEHLNKTHKLGLRSESSGRQDSLPLADLAPISVWQQVLRGDTLNAMSGLRERVLDDDGKARPQTLHIALRKSNVFEATDLKDKIYGVLGLVDPTIHYHLKVDYGNSHSVADVYLDAMTYMFNMEKDALDLIDLYLVLPLPLSTDNLLPGLPSWVPDFSLKAPFLAHTGDLTWYYLYQVNSIHRGSKPFLRLHHGRHIVNRDPVEVTVEGRRLLSKGILVDEIEATVTSRIFSNTEEFKKHMAKVHDQQASSADESERKAAEQGRSIMQHLDNALDGDLTEDAFNDPETFLRTMVALKLERTIQRGTLKEVDQICRANSTRLGRDVNSDRWMTNIWRDLFEGYRELENITEEKFLAEFHYLVGGTVPVSQQEWIEKLYTETTSEDLSGHGGRYPVNDALRTLFSNHKRFFTMKYSGFYGIGLPKIEVGDKLVLLFPPVYMAFILRPLGDEYQMVGPAIVPLILRTKFLWDKATLRRDLDSFVIV